MVDTLKEFTLVQEATQVPAEWVKDVKVISLDPFPKGVLLIQLPDHWIRIDTLHQTFAVGAYEG